MVHRIEIRPKAGFGDPHAAGVLAQTKELGIETVTAVRSVRLFFLFGELGEQATFVLMGRAGLEDLPPRDEPPPGRGRIIFCVTKRKRSKKKPKKLSCAYPTYSVTNRQTPNI